eukprot:NODE_5840_length_548_cov_41.997996_g5097_i0.p1 GENE.NODE_5840_length_548_cov_41.997996_g5097_i0~~NODE_5840_length_548_cov_41.997996_g5097_i0.p1  ORF type:complete len:125 (+),score=23.99 NODE_5840_length_548_cov_41.997996_g5097_i0:79-453(+)
MRLTAHVGDVVWLTVQRGRYSIDLPLVPSTLSPTRVAPAPRPLLGMRLAMTQQCETLVEAVGGGGAAERAGLMAGDLLETWNGVALNSAAAVQQQMSRAQVGDTVWVTVRRGGVPATVPLVLKN